MFKFVSVLAVVTSVLSLANADAAQTHPDVELRTAPDGAPTYSFQVRTAELARLHSALAEYSQLFGYSLAFRDIHFVPPGSRLYELMGADSRIGVADPFDPQIYFFSVFAENEVRARQVCQQLIKILARHGIVAAPPVDFGNPPPVCPS